MEREYTNSGRFYVSSEYKLSDKDITELRKKDIEKYIDSNPVKVNEVRKGKESFLVVLAGPERVFVANEAGVTNIPYLIIDTLKQKNLSLIRVIDLSPISGVLSQRPNEILKKRFWK